MAGWATLQYLLAGGDTAGEGHLGHRGVVAHEGPRLRAALHHIEEAVRSPRLLVDLRQDHRGHRGEGGRLEHHGIACSTQTEIQRYSTLYITLHYMMMANQFRD